MSKSVKVATTAIVAAVASWVAITSPANAELKLIVTHAVPPLVPNSVMDLADTLGMYKKVGLDLKIIRVQQTPSAIAALRSGSGDMANISTSAALMIVARNQMKLRAVTSPNKAIPFLIAGKNSIKSINDIAGHSFGVGRIGSLDYTLSRLVMKSRGIDLKKIQMVAIGQPRVRAQAMIGGRIDATTMSVGVWSSIKDTTGFHILVQQAEYFKAAPLLSKVNVVTAETLVKKGAEIKKFIKAIVLMSREFAKNPDSWADAMHKIRPQIPRAKLGKLARAYAKSWSVNGGLNLDQVAYTTKRQYYRKDFKGLRKVAPSEWIVTGLIDDVLKDTGVAAGMDATGR